MNIVHLKRETWEEMSAIVKDSAVEQGFLLGTANELETIDHYVQSKAIEKGFCYIKPDARMAERVLHKWAAEGIVFLGYMHSHPSGKEDLSEDDMSFARELFQRYGYALYFGIIPIHMTQASCRMFRIAEKEGKPQIQECRCILV